MPLPSEFIGLCHEPLFWSDFYWESGLHNRHEDGFLLDFPISSEYGLTLWLSGYLSTITLDLRHSESSNPINIYEQLIEPLDEALGKLNLGRAGLFMSGYTSSPESGDVAGAVPAPPIMADEEEVEVLDDGPVQPDSSTASSASSVSLGVPTDIGIYVVIHDDLPQGIQIIQDVLAQADAPVETTIRLTVPEHRDIPLQPDADL